jgi:4-oxalmesaconate hydratase
MQLEAACTRGLAGATRNYAAAVGCGQETYVIIDCHGHYTTVPKTLHAWRQAQLAGDKPDPAGPAISDDEIRASIEGGQLKQQQERGADLTLFSPIAGQMGHHLGDLETSIAWSRVNNDIIARVCRLFPNNFVAVCQLPQSPGAPVEACAEELERCVLELGFVGCNLNPDASGGHWTVPPMTDRSLYPLYEKMVELDVPAMIHVSGSCAPGVHHTGAHYINGDTTTFMQLIQNDLFKDFPELRLIIPHGGGAVPYHWGRYRGLALDMGREELEDGLLRNVYFDTCVYHQPGIDLLTSVIPVKNVLFGSEMIGAVKGVDPRTGHNFDDTKRYIDAAAFLTDADRQQIFEGNARRVFPRLDAKLALRGR